MLKVLRRNRHFQLRHLSHSSSSIDVFVFPRTYQQIIFGMAVAFSKAGAQGRKDGDLHQANAKNHPAAPQVTAARTSR